MSILIWFYVSVYVIMVIYNVINMYNMLAVMANSPKMLNFVTDEFLKSDKEGDTNASEFKMIFSSAGFRVIISFIWLLKSLVTTLFWPLFVLIGLIINDSDYVKHGSMVISKEEILINLDESKLNFFKR